MFIQSNKSAYCINLYCYPIIESLLINSNNDTIYSQPGYSLYENESDYYSD